MIHPSHDNRRTLPRRRHMTESEVDRPPRLGSCRKDFEIRGGSLEEEPWTLSPDVLRDPSRGELAQELEAAKKKANGRSRVRLVPSLSPSPVLAHPHGLMEDNGLPPGNSGLFGPLTSAVGVAWFTRGGVKCVRAWGNRWHATGPEHSFIFLPGPSDKEGIRCCWASVFPRRFFRLRTRRQERLRRTLEHMGPPGKMTG